MPMIQGLRVMVLGDRNYPLRTITLGEQHVEGWDALIEKLREQNPAADEETLLRAALRYGMRAVDQYVRAGMKPSVDGVFPRPPKAGHERDDG